MYMCCILEEKFSLVKHMVQIIIIKTIVKCTFMLHNMYMYTVHVIVLHYPCDLEKTRVQGTHTLCAVCTKVSTKILTAYHIHLQFMYTVCPGGQGWTWGTRVG